MKYFDGKNKIVQTKKSNYKKGKRIFFFFEANEKEKEL